MRLKKPTQLIVRELFKLRAIQLLSYMHQIYLEVQDPDPNPKTQRVILLNIPKKNPLILNRKMVTGARYNLAQIPLHFTPDL